MQEYLAAIAIFLAIDSIWLLTGGIYARQLVERIQGRPLNVRFLSAGIVYLAMAYLVLKADSAMEAFGQGLATYAVYDFTTHALLTNYDWRFAVADTIWGGILFALTFIALKSFGYKN
jgi:uncharacterized membrane protein